MAGEVSSCATGKACDAVARCGFAERLQQLFAQVTSPESGEEYTCAEVAAGVTRAGGPPLSARAIHRMRSGAAGNPTRAQVEALAEFFNVSPVSFFGSRTQERHRADLASLALVPDPSIRRLVLRLAQMSSRDVAAVAHVIDQCSDRTERVC